MISPIQFCVICLTLHFIKCLPAEDNDTNNDAVTPSVAGPFDEALVTSILKIVDVKFESISTRIGSMERAMNSLQYYNLRQFRVVNTHLRALDTIMQATHSQMGEIDIESKETKISIDMLKKELKNMEKVQNAMFDSMEKHFEKSDFSTGEKFASLQESADIILNTALQNTEKISQDKNINLGPLIESLVSVLNDSNRSTNERLTSLEEKVDTNHNITMSKLEGVEVEIANSTNNKTEERSLLETLIDLNDNVLRSIDFYRHTGDLVERIVGATETVADEQDTIRSDLRLFLEVQTNNTMCNRQQDKMDSNELPNVIVADRNLHRCELTFQELNEMADIFRNSTHLTDQWTEMAQLNQFTLRSTVMDLMAEVAKLHDINEKENTFSEQTTTTAPNLFTGLMEFDLESISNNTKAVYQIVEAVAANTGWIPYIYHNLQFVESQVNETVKNYKNILQKQETLSDILRSHDRTEALTGRPAIMRGFGNSESRPTTQTDMFISNDGNTSYLDKLNIIYRTNVKMHRLIPALTRLLGEPEPFITLVDGKNENEGRVEIYRNGRWGTLCKDIDHIEASYICRHLGYLGGISAGSGFYGAGDGVFWKLNMTCLLTRRCEVANGVDASLCSHNNDAAIICDHMVRLDADERKRRSAGYLNIHHRGNWLNVCADNWTSQNSNVACRQLGHKSGQAAPPVTDPKTVEVNNLWLRNITCSGSEMRLDACDHVIWSRGCESNLPVRISCT
ncbi:uncharacterized protein LOC117343222 [Pecten maximus]|uniref:uncharacterized protein LOC117343222 n=1 Tax=Pecten maximus TaxID=6579 RepID=UPI0014589132|nr:uncharacterized protein LOC117343222 [Pecten maximus]